MLKLLALFVIYAIISAFGLYNIKSSVGNIVSFQFFTGLFCYGFGFLLWLYVLKNAQLSIAFPIASTSLIIATQLIGALFLKEPFTFTKTVATLFVACGIFLYFLEIKRS